MSLVVFLKRIAKNFVEGEIIDEGGQGLQNFLDHVGQKNPKLLATLLTGMYGAAKIYGEDYVKSTPYDDDDKVLAEAEKDIETIAAKYGITLPDVKPADPGLPPAEEKKASDGL